MRVLRWWCFDVTRRFRFRLKNLWKHSFGCGNWFCSFKTLSRDGLISQYGCGCVPPTFKCISTPRHWEMFQLKHAWEQTYRMQETPQWRKLPLWDSIDEPWWKYSVWVIDVPVDELAEWLPPTDPKEGYRGGERISEGDEDRERKTESARNRAFSFFNFPICLGFTEIKYYLHYHVQQLNILVRAISMYSKTFQSTSNTRHPSGLSVSSGFSCECTAWKRILSLLDGRKLSTPSHWK